MQNLNIQNLQNPSPSLPLTTPPLKTEGPSFQEVLQNTDIQPTNIKGFKIIVILEHYTHTAVDNGQLSQNEAKDILDQCGHCKHHKPHKAPFSHIEKELQDLISELTTSLDSLSKEVLPSLQDPTLVLDQKTGITELEQKLNQSTCFISPETKDMAENLLTQLQKLLEILLKLQDVTKPIIEEKIAAPAVNVAPPKENVPVSSDTDTSAQENLGSEKPSIDPSINTHSDTTQL